MLEFSLIKQHRPRFNVRLRDDKSYPFLAVTLDEEWPRADGDAGRASARACATSAPTATPTPSARRSTCCCARSRSARASDNKFDRHQRARAGRACCSTSRSARARASARSTRSDYDRLVEELLEFLDGDTDAGRPAPRGADARGGGRAGVRAGGPPPRPAGRGAQGDREAADGGRPQRGPRRDRHRRRRARGRGAGVLRAQGPGRGPQGLRRRQGRGPHRAASWSAACSRASTARARRWACPSRCSCRASPTTRDAVRGWLAELPGRRRSRSGCRSGATSATLQETVTRNAERGVHPPPAAPRRPTTTAGPRRSTSCRTSSACPRRRCASSAST